jgi:hypothetical protein
MERGPHVIARLPLAQLIISVALCAVSAFTFRYAFDTTELIAPLVLALAVGAAIPIVVRVLGARSFASSLAVALLCWLSASSLVLFGSVLAPSQLRDGLVHGWGQILSSFVPVPTKRTLLVIPFTLTFAAAYSTVELVLRTRRRFLVTLPACVLIVLASMLGARRGHAAAPFTILFAAAFVVLVLLRSRLLDDSSVAPDRRSRVDDATRSVARHQLVRGVPAAAGALVVAILATTPFAGTSHAFELRDHWALPQQTTVELNPLARVSKPGTAALFSVQFDTRPTQPVRFPISALDRFDGSAWSSDDAFHPSGTSFAGSTGSAAEEHASGSSTAGTATPEEPAQRIVQHIEVNHLDDDILPALVNPISVTGLSERSLQYDASSGRILVSENMSRASYRVVSEVAQPDVSRLGEAELGTGPDAVAASETERISLPPNLRAASAAIFEQASTPFQQIARLVAFFHNDKTVNRGSPFTVDKTVASGHTLAHLELFVADPKRSPDVIGRRGTSEQFATAFAVLARANGFPVRVMVGYIPRIAGTTVEVHESDLTAWPEVKLSGFGWVAFDPEPKAKSNDGSDAQSQSFAPKITKAVADSSKPHNASAPGTNPNVAPSVTHPGGGNALPLWLGVGVVVVLGGTFTIPVLKRRRRRVRRLRGSPAARVLGAWKDANDRMTEAGRRTPVSATTPEAVSLSRSTFGDTAALMLDELGRIVDRTLYGTAPVSDEDATQAWSLADVFTRDIFAAQPRSRRLRFALDPRPLVSSRAR